MVTFWLGQLLSNLVDFISERCRSLFPQSHVCIETIAILFLQTKLDYTCVKIDGLRHVFGASEISGLNLSQVLLLLMDYSDETVVVLRCLPFLIKSFLADLRHFLIKLITVFWFCQIVLMATLVFKDTISFTTLRWIEPATHLTCICNSLVVSCSSILLSLLMFSWAWEVTLGCPEARWDTGPLSDYWYKLWIILSILRSALARLKVSVRWLAECACVSQTIKIYDHSRFFDRIACSDWFVWGTADVSRAARNWGMIVDAWRTASIAAVVLGWCHTDIISVLCLLHDAI